MEKTRISILSDVPHVYDIIKRNLIRLGLRERGSINPFIKKLPGIYEYTNIPYGKPHETANRVKENSDILVIDMNTYPDDGYVNFLDVMAELKETDGIRVVMHYVSEPGVYLNEMNGKIPYFELEASKSNYSAFDNAKTYQHMAKLLSLDAKL